MKTLQYFPLFLIGFSVFVTASSSGCESNSRKFSNRALNQLHCLIKNPPAPVTVELASGENVTLSSDEIVYQDKAFLKSVLGLELEAQIGFDEKDEALRKANDVRQATFGNASFEKLDAISTISDLARSTSVVMLNEAHHVSKHRVFALELAKTLKRQGYTHIAAETFSDVNTMMDLGFPTTDNGYYIRDPEFGHFIRQSMKLGYKLVEYESSASNRESMQAENLAQFLNKNPDAKVLVYAGYGHIRERPKTLMMASILKGITDIEPLTIDQVGGTPKQSVSLTDANYKYIKHEILKSPSVFKSQSNGEWLVSEHYSNDVDITVFHAEEYLKNGRANWLVSSAERTEYEINLKSLNIKEPFFVKAVLENEYQSVGDKAIPVDQLLVANSDQSVYLYLPSGNYIVFLEKVDQNDVLLKKIEVSESSIRMAKVLCVSPREFCDWIKSCAHMCMRKQQQTLNTQVEAIQYKPIMNQEGIVY